MAKAIKLKGNNYEINIPTYKELEQWGIANLIENPEERYFEGLRMFMSTPSEWKSFFDSLGVNTNEVSQYDFFAMALATEDNAINDFLKFTVKINGVPFDGFNMYHKAKGDNKWGLVIKGVSPLEMKMLYNPKKNITLSERDYVQIRDIVLSEFADLIDFTGLTFKINVLEKIYGVQKYINEIYNTSINQIPEMIYVLGGCKKLLEEAEVESQQIQNEKHKTKTVNLSDIKIKRSFKRSLPHPDKIQKCYEHYRKHGSIGKEIVVDDDMVLQDGFAGYLVLKMVGVDEVEVVVRDIIT
jgi:hypothetical protein